MNRMLLFTNILTPYRCFFYDLLYEECKINCVDFRVVVMSETEKGRNWKYEDFERKYTTLLKGKSIKMGKLRFNINQGISKLVTEYNPDFVIAAGSYIHPSLWILLHLVNTKKIPVFFWSESHLYEKRDYNVIQLHFRELMRQTIYAKFDGFFYSGKLSKEFIETYCKKGTKKIFLPNLIDDTYYSTIVMDKGKKENIKKQLGISNHEKIYFIPARLIEVKGIIPFLNMIKSCNSLDKIKILIAGDGILQDEISDFIKKNRLPIILLGYKEQKDIRELYQISDGFILPSLSDPNPLSCIEALWSKLPLFISEHVGNYPEVVEEGINGFVFSYRNTENARNMFESFINKNDEWYFGASQRSFAIAQQLYNSHNEVRRIFQEINSYLDNTCIN